MSGRGIDFYLKIYSLKVPSMGQLSNQFDKDLKKLSELYHCLKVAS